MVVNRTGEEIVPRRLHFFTSAGGGVEFGAHNADVDTLIRGLVERVFLHKEGREFVAPPEPNARGFRNALRPFTLAYRRYARGLTPLSNDEFVASCDSRKRAIYEQAKVELEAYGLLERDYWLKTFVKYEKLNFTKKSDPAPRVIQPRSPKFNVAYGRYIRPLEGVMYKNIAKIFGGVTVCKGLNAAQVGELIREKWEMFADPAAVSVDCSRFDQHMSVAALQYLHSLFRLHFKQREFARLCRRTIDQKGSARCLGGRVKYRVRGKKASGEMDTSLCGCVLMCALLYSYAVEVGLVRPNQFRKFVAIIDNGDDSVVFLSRRLLPLLAGLPQWLLDRGFPAAIEEPVFQMEHIVFCQTSPVFDGTSWTMVRDPRICLDKDLCTTKPIPNARAWNTLRNSVAKSGLALAGNMPIFCEFYRCLERGAGTRIDKDLTMSGFKFLARGMDASHKPVTDQARLSFWEAFGITVGHQLNIEAHYRALTLRYSTPVHVAQCPQHPGFMGSAF